MRKYLLSALISILFAGFSSATIDSVSVGNFYFTPVSFDISVGDTIIWTLVEGTHTTTSTSVPAGAVSWDHTFSGVGDSYSYVVAVAGVYEYHCSFHPTVMMGSFSTSVPLPFYENFEFPAGDNITSHGWVAHSAGGTNPITVNNGNLTFPGYPSSGIGNAALLSGNSEDDHRMFDSQTADSVYMAFMVNVTDNPNGYFIHFATNPYSFDYRGRIFLEGTNPNLEFGLSFATEAAVVTSNNYSLGTTYLLVLKYTIFPDVNNDQVSLYVFDGGAPPSEPASPTIGPISNAAATDINPGAVSFRKYSANENLVVDGIRVAATWSDAVPVELSSFTASVNNNSVTLNWKTATETNNRGFQIQRKTSNSGWTNVSFVNGNGTSTKSNEYSYVDNNLESGNYSYRLKQVDFDGSSEFSKVVEVEVNNPVKFELSQNYPNPFNPTTKINFSVPSNGNVRLTVYNVLGQEIAVLVNGFMKSGSHTIDFNASDLNSGLYFYKLEGNGMSQVKKMMLVK
ncbi:MAG TPA: T9SS type A sorting domain-containing protein [Ignavibacteriaceae bacterium]|jgi:plastocyanin|nr:T9SS type A sorting domain-containing protein [Ignavibacteriaceae bacterium]